MLIYERSYSVEYLVMIKLELAEQNMSPAVGRPTYVTPRKVLAPPQTLFQDAGPTDRQLIGKDLDQLSESSRCQHDRI